MAKRKDDAEEKTTESASDQPKEPRKCGLIMPISARDGLPASHWLDVRRIIRNALKEDGFDAELVSESAGSDIIHRRIIHSLYTNPVCVCDISTLNPNVMFELGIRLTFDLPTIIIRDSATDLPFDTTLIRCLSYPRDLRYWQVRRFGRELRTAVKQAIEARAKGDKTYSFMQSVGDIAVPKIGTKEVEPWKVMQEEIRELKDLIRRRASSDITSKVQADLPFPKTIEEKRSIRAFTEKLIRHDQNKVYLRRYETMCDADRSSFVRTILDQVALEFGCSVPREAIEKWIGNAANDLDSQ